MYGAYKRTVSAFQNSSMVAEGRPTQAELTLLEPFRGKVPDDVFGEPVQPPVSDGSRAGDRALVRKASQLLQAGRISVIKDGKRVDAKGEPIAFEFLIDEPEFPAASHAIHQEPRHAWHRRDAAHRRPGAVSQARR